MNLKRWIALLLTVVLAAALLTACGGKNNAQDNDGESQPADSTGEAGQGFHIKNASNFDIQYLADGVKLLTDSAGRELLLTPEGTAVPTGYEDAVKVSTPIKRAMFTSTTHVGFLESLEDAGLYGSIAALTTEESQWSNQAVLDGFASGQITYVAQDTWTAGDLEAVITAAPDLVFLDTSREEGMALAGMLDQVGIPYVAASEWSESGSEAYLEWMKFFAAFYNLDEKADSLYNAGLSRLEDLYTQMASIPENERPVVAFGMVFGGVVYTQAGNSTIAKQLERAGAVYALKDLEGEGAVQIGMEEFLDKCKDADVLIYDSLPQYMMGTLLDEDPLFAEFKAYQNGRVFTMDNGYYMKSAQVVEKFEDIVAICHPELEENHQFTIYQPLGE